MIFGGSPNTAADDLVATSVEFVYNGETHQAFVKKDVVLSAGLVSIQSQVSLTADHTNSALKTPQILELSGIGRRDVLEKIGVPLNIELPGVGENMQDHSTFGMRVNTKFHASLKP